MGAMTLTSCLGGQEERPWTCCASEPFESFVNLQLELSPQSPEPAGNSRERKRSRGLETPPPPRRPQSKILAKAETPSK